MPYEIGITEQEGFISANHNVVKGYDITLIIKNDGKNGSIQSDDRLSFNKIQNISTGKNHEDGNYFEISNIFQIDGSPAFTNVPSLFNDNGDIIFPNIITDIPPYIYINLRPTDILPRYDTLDLKRAVFTLHHTHHPHHSDVLNETILESFDPNFVEVQSVCIQKNKDQFVNYHVQFQNTGGAQVTQVSIKLSFPEGFDLNSLNVTSWNLGGNTIDGGQVESVNSNNIPCDSFSFGGHYLQALDLSNDRLSTGFIEFCIKVDPSLNLKSYGTSLKLIQPVVTMDGVDYYINDFYDLQPAHKCKLLKTLGCRSPMKRKVPGRKADCNCMN